MGYGNRNDCGEGKNKRVEVSGRKGEKDQKVEI